MKKYLLLLLLFLINFWGYSQTQATVTEIAVDGARTVTFTNPAPIELNEAFITTATTGFDKSDGKLYIVFKGRTEPYTYSWKKNLDNYTPAKDPDNPNTWINFSAGEYTVIASKDGCSSLSIDFTIERPAELLISLIQPNKIGCFGGTTTLAINNNTATGGYPYVGTKNYTYSWYKCDDSNGSNPALISDARTNPVTLGFYYVEVNDGKNIKKSNIVQVTQNEQITVSENKIEPPCNGNNGSVALAISGGKGNYNVTWTGDDINTAIITNNGKNLSGKAGTYNYIITDADVPGCSIPGSVTFTDPTPVLITSINQTQPSSSTANDGTITINASGGTGTYKYFVIKDGGSEVQYGTNVIANLGNGDYIVRVVDVNGCASDSRLVSLRGLNVAVLSTSLVLKCFGDTTGSISIQASGGTLIVNQNYTYKWYRNGVEFGGNSPSIIGLSYGTYYVIVRDNLNPIQSQNFIISPPPTQLQVSIANTSDISCPGANDGAITLNVSGGTGSYAYQWHDNVTTKDRTNLKEGTYKVTVKDENGCPATLEDIKIVSPSAITIPQPTISNVSIYGQKTGAITFINSPTGGEGNFIYSWTSDKFTGTKNSLNLSNLEAGVYTLVVTDGNGCTNSKPFTVTQNLELKVDIKETAFIKCFGGTNGQLTAEVNGGVAPYSYVWKKWNDVLLGENQSTITNLSKGMYSVYVTDSANPGGPYALANQLNYDLKEPNELRVAVINSTNVLCHNETTGAISIDVNGGNAPYTYQWTKNGADYPITTKDLINLGAGTYQVIVTDAVGHNCTATLQDAVFISQPEEPLKIDNVSKTNLTGYETNNGSIVVKVMGGSKDYSYEWTKDADTTIIGTTASIANLSKGMYYLLVKDTNGCTLPKVQYEITQPDKLEIVLTPTPNTELKCFGATTAEYRALITGGVKEYALEWLNTTTGQKYSSIETITTLNTISVASNLAYGNYVVTVKDAKNNILFGTNTFTINQPDLLAFTYNTTPVSCFGGSNGSIQLIITGGTKSSNPNSPYSISSDGGTIDAKNGIISGLSAGKYKVSVTDANNCQTAQQEIVITAPEKALYIASQVSTPTTGFGLATGKIEISVDGGTPIDPGNGGTPTYIYTWKNSAGSTIGTNSPTLSNIAAGEYSVVITDTKGCELPKTFTVLQPTKPLVSETHLQAKCNGLTGSLDATATVGATFEQNQSEKTYTYRLKNKTTGITASIVGTIAKFENIADGEYELTATDVAGIISNTIPVTFKQPAPTVVNLIQKNVSCYNGNDGSLEAVVIGGKGPYTYIWKKETTSIGSNTSKIESLSKGNYTLEIRDSNYNSNLTAYCVNVATTSISEPTDELAIGSFTSTDATGYQTNNGKIEVIPSGGTPTYQYQWFFNGTVINNQSNNSVSNLAPGEYKVIVTDTNLICSIEKTFTINEPKLLEFKVLTTNVLCFGEQNGSINAIATGGVKDNNGFYTYTLFDRNKNVLESQKALEAKFDTKFADTYYIQVTDFNLNTTPSNLNDLIPVVIEQPNKALTLVEIKKNNATCPNEADGSIIFETSGGTPNYKYTLLNVNKNTSSQVNDSAIENLSAGTYTLTVTDSNDCVQSKTFTITEPEDFGFDKEKFTLTKPILPETNWSINVVMKGGQNDYKYSIKNSSGNILLEKVVSDKFLLINQLPTDIYTVSVTDNTGCTKTEIIDLTNNVLAASIQQTKQIVCNGEGANIEALVTGGLGIKTYTWYKNNEIIPLENGTTLTNYGSGEYKFSCIDTAKLEVISNTITITQPDVVEIKSILKTNSTCNGANDGTISIDVMGGSGSYLYSLNATNWTAFSASSTAIINNLPTGDYTVYVKDSKGCNAIATALAKIEQPSILTISKINTSSTSGFGLSNGSIAVVIDGGNGNYVYKWFNENKIDINQSTSTAINLVAGKYYVEITDSKNCSITSELITISQPEKLTTLINPINQVIYCYGDKSIQLTATVAGGVPNYNFEWYDSSNFMIGTNPTSPFVGAGNYYLKVIDKNGNTATSTSVTITEPELILTSNTVVDVNCIGEENGSVTLKASGGSNTFEYRFKPENDSYGNWISFTSKNSTIHEGLKAGKYTFQIKDKNGILCSNVPNLEVSIAQPLAPISLINSKTIVTAASGFGLANGSITVEATGGNGNYAYQWFKNGSTTTIANTNTANNLAAGKYFVNVTDAKGCKLTSLLIEVTEPALLITSAAVQNIILCNGDSNGSLRPITLGGFLKPGENYTYQWFADGNATALATTTILNNIGKGSYYVIVTDSNGNKATSKSITITEPDILKNTLSADYTLCGDANDWTITTAPTGGTTAYNYSWNTGDKTPSIQNVPPGKYSVVITDKNGCRVTNEITITATQPLSTAAQIKKPTCFDGDDATIVLTTTGGKGPYTYLWSTGAQTSQLSNAKAGTYSVTITDVKGCIIKEEYKIENPPKDLLNLGEDVTLCLDQTLTINATINDDKAIYFWQSDKGFTSNKPIVTLKEPANYILTITNKLGCKAVDTITISSQNTPINAEFAMSSQVFTNEVFTVINISDPKPDSIEWILPAEAIVKTKSKDYAEMSFSKPGEYDISITSKKGNCTAFQTKTVLVLEGEYKDPDTTDAMKNFDLKIFPNPSDGIFSIDITLDKVMPATVKIFSLINNSIIASKSENGKQTYTFDFNLSGMIPGVYFILFESQQGSKLRKIIIK
ncbi:putative secreted protein (Por secretion system target) [Flavobacterium tiangeerense]|uniref:Secreted protein (Por secretion system target) n=1 Tax=Flavobacterium tiangeerense TaxID=459471 RepID=A0ABY3FL36_9FLAO|nr:T9SS type A sorting domain-containing protein [Flavobacterium tiangeerense]TWI01150.1 putative secreted protein (Por secretion system target) [Flavobacterium tiangeerense]